MTPNYTDFKTVGMRKTYRYDQDLLSTWGLDYDGSNARVAVIFYSFKKGNIYQ